MNPGHLIKLEICLCHREPIKRPRGRQARCKETGHFCLSKHIKRWQPDGKKKSPMVSVSPSNHPTETPIRRSQTTQRYIELSREQRSLIHTSNLWDYLWPFSRLNLVTKEISIMIEAGVIEMLRGENSAIRRQRRQMAKAEALRE